MSNSRKRSPQKKHSPAGGRKPRIASEPDAGDQLEFRWRTECMDYGGPFSWELLTVREFCAQVVVFLHQFETMTWGDLLRGGHHHLAWSSVSQEACARFEQVREAIPVANLDTELLSLRLTGRKRIIGIRDRRTLYILWWAPEHQVSPSPKK